MVLLPALPRLRRGVCGQPLSAVLGHPQNKGAAGEMLPATTSALTPAPPLLCPALQLCCPSRKMNRKTSLSPRGEHSGAQEPS